MPTFDLRLGVRLGVGRGDRLAELRHNAGHPSPILLRRETGAVISLHCERHNNGGLLGIVRDTRYTTGRMESVVGDRVLLFTDGLFEIQDSNREILGLEGLAAVAASLMARPGEEFVQDLLETVKRHSAHGKFEDDVCLVSLDILERLGQIPG